MILKGVAERVDWYFCDRARRRGLRNPMPSDLNIRVLDLPDARIRAYVSGTGPDLVMLPDPPNTIEHHAELIGRLRHSHRIICFEFPGFGLSYPKPTMAFTLDGLTAVFRQVFEALEIADAFLAISCLGSYVGVNFALHHPERVSRLALIQVTEIGQAIAWSRKTDVAGLIATPVIGQALTQSLKRQVIRHWYASALNLDPDHPRCRRYIDIALGSVRHGSCFCLASAYQMLRAHPVIDWSRLYHPTLLVYGSKDPTHEATRWDALLSRLPDCRAVHFENSAHFPNLEEPDRFAALIEDRA